MTALQEKLSLTNNKVAEFRNQCEKLKKDLKVAHKVSFKKLCWGTFNRLTSVFHTLGPVIDHEFCHNIVKVAVDPRGDS